MSRQDLEQAMNDMRSQAPSESMVREAARRVARDVFDATHVPERIARIRGCADFQALLPEYESGTLTAARRALVKDHLATCVECRRALRASAAINQTTPTQPLPRVRSRRPLLAMALAATLAAGAAVGLTGAFRGLLPGQHAVRASVISVQGVLYKVNEFSSSVVTAGALIRNADQLRTGKGSTAVFRLVDGATVEIGERSDITVSRGWRDTSVDVDRGRVIVQPPSHSRSRLLVSAGDIRIPVYDAVLAVDHGTKGSRVALAKGSTSFEHSGQKIDLHAGQQYGYHLANVSLQSEFAWSQNSGQYLSLLKEFSTLQKQWGTIPPPGLRYSSDLAPYLPANTVFYAAIPNVGNTLAEAKRIFDERLSQSDVLRQWWQQQPAARNGELDRALEQIGSVSQYLGSEIVCAITLSSPQHYSQPLFLADLRQPGLQDYLHQAVPGGLGPLSVVVKDNLVLASPDAQFLAGVSQTVSSKTAGGFTQTPFYNRIAQSYSSGAGYLLAVSMEQIVAASVNKPKEVPPGFDNAQYLVLEKRDLSADNTETRAALSFAGGRQGIPSWLGAPGPMGSLDFISPNAQLAVSFIMKNPRTVMQELIQYASGSDAASAQHFSDLQKQLGVNLADDLAAPFGSDATFAVDGPLLPVPAWRVAAEVYNFPLLQQTISTLVQHANAQAGADAGKLLLTSEQVDGYTVYSLRNSKLASFAACYTYVDGYLLAAPDSAGLLQAIGNHRNGTTLVSSRGFQSQLPADGYTNFSGMLWHNAGRSLDALAGQVKNSGALASLFANSGPGLICIYGEPDRIVAAGKGGFLGFNLATLAGIGQGQPIPKVMASRNRL